MSARRRPAHRGLIALGGVLVLVLAVLAAVQVWAPPQDVPWKRLTLDQPIGLATGWKVYVIGGDAARCRRTLGEGGIDFPADRARRAPPCAVSAGGRLVLPEAALYPERPLMSCREALAFAVWERQSVQRQARAILGSPVVAIDHMGTYNCRPVRGSGPGNLSQHAFANAIDVGGFRLADGREITIADDFRRTDAAGVFLRRVRDQACKVFRVTLSPDYNTDHRTHFHLDMGPWGQCR